MDSKYTQGQWALNDNDGKIYELSSQREICSIPSDDEEDMANAQLLLTAPDLLKALDDLLILCETECNGVWHGNDAWEEAKNAREAIAKATKENF